MKEIIILDRKGESHIKLHVGTNDGVSNLETEPLGFLFSFLFTSRAKEF